MNELKDLCVSLETAKKMVEAGIKIDAVFSWFFHPNAIHNDPMLKFTNDNRSNWSCYPAPTFEELEKYVTMDYFDYEIKLHSHYNEGKTMIECHVLGGHDRQDYIKSIWHEKKSDVMAEVLIELKKQGLLKGRE